jgi:hypothetical protein
MLVFLCNNNLGRGKINLLNQKSLVNYLLILNDTFQGQLFHKKTIWDIQGKTTVTFGHFIWYAKPKKEQLLRWVYGHKGNNFTKQK